MIYSCARKACMAGSGLPDELWITLRPLKESASSEEKHFCSPRCAVLWLENEYGLSPDLAY